MIRRKGVVKNNRQDEHNQRNAVLSLSTALHQLVVTLFKSLCIICNSRIVTQQGIKLSSRRR